MQQQGTMCFLEFRTLLVLDSDLRFTSKGAMRHAYRGSSAILFPIVEQAADFSKTCRFSEEQVKPVIVRKC
jgi:hypothetical protein